MLQLNKKRLKKLWQFVVFVSCFISIIMLFMYSNQLNKQNYKMLYDQTEALSRLVLRQTASTAGVYIANDDMLRIKQLVDQLDSDPLVLDVSIYDAKGNKVISSEQTMPLSQLTGLNTPLAIDSIGRQQLVEPIIYQHDILGFVRITLEHGQLIKSASNRLERSINLVRMMVLIALITGAIFVFTFASKIDWWLSGLPIKHDH